MDWSFTLTYIKWRILLITVRLKYYFETNAKMKLTVLKTLVSTEKSQVFKQTYLSMRDL